MMFETKPVRITELAKETEQYLLQKGCKKSTLGVYKATWHKFMAFSSSDVYSRTAAEVFLKLPSLPYHNAVWLLSLYAFLRSQIQPSVSDICLSILVLMYTRQSKNWILECAML